MAQNEDFGEDIHVETDTIRKKVKITYTILKPKVKGVRLKIFYNGIEISNPKISFESTDFSKGPGKVLYWDVRLEEVFANADFNFEFTAIKDPINPTPNWVHWSARTVVLGGLVGSTAVWLNFKRQENKLNELASIVDPDGDGQIVNTTLNDQWREQYAKTEAAAKKQLSNALLGAFAMAACVELYAILHDAKAKKKNQRLSLSPSNSSLGVSLSYRFNKQKP